MLRLFMRIYKNMNVKLPFDHYWKCQENALQWKYNPGAERNIVQMKWILKHRHYFYTGIILTHLLFDILSLADGTDERLVSTK